MEINLNMGVFNALEDNEMMEIDGGGCSWKGADSGIVQGAVGGGLLGGVGGDLAYAATCWWGD